MRWSCHACVASVRPHFGSAVRIALGNRGQLGLSVRPRVHRPCGDAGLGCGRAHERESARMVRARGGGVCSDARGDPPAARGSRGVAGAGGRWRGASGLRAGALALQRGASSGKRLVIGGVFTLIALAALGWIGLFSLPILSRGAAASSDSGTIVDVLAFATAALLAARPSLGARRAMALAGLPVALVVTTLGLAVLRDGPIRKAIDERAPAFAVVAHLAARLH